MHVVVGIVSLFFVLAGAVMLGHTGTFSGVLYGPALLLVGVHSTQVRRSVAQTNGAAQSPSARHWTQWLAPSTISQRPVGAEQSASPPHPAEAAQWPSPAVTPTQVSPLGHPLRPGPHPGMQNPPGPLQTRPEAAPPQAASVEQPHRPVAARHCG